MNPATSTTKKAPLEGAFFVVTDAKESAETSLGRKQGSLINKTETSHFDVSVLLLSGEAVLLLLEEELDFNLSHPCGGEKGECIFYQLCAKIYSC